MAIATYFHPKSLTAEQYDKAIKELEAAGAASPAGRIHHSCFGPGTDLMVYEVWESQQAFENYGPVLMPILQKVGIDPGTPDVMPIHSLIS
jgi:quinol monooxygenase YgiN